MTKKSILAMSLLFVGLLAGCTEGDFIEVEEPKTATEYDEELTEQVSKMKEQKEEAINQDPSDLSDSERERREQLILGLLQSEMGHSTDISFSTDDLAFRFLLTDEELIAEIVAIASGEFDIDGWNELVDNHISMSLEVQEILGYGYKIIYLNPIDPKTMLLVIMDGKVYYDALNE